MKKLLVFVVAMALAAIAVPAMADVLGSPHDFHGMVGGGADTGRRGLCEICHVPHASSAATAKRLWRVNQPGAGGTNWTGSIVGRLCGTCHETGGAVAYANVNGDLPHTVESSVYANNSHQRSYDTLVGTAVGQIKDTPAATSALRPYFGAGKLMECTSCHNVHKNNVMPFLRVTDPVAQTAMTDVCGDCHNRANGTANRPKLGSNNQFQWNGAAANHSMHPTNIPFADFTAVSGGNGTTALHSVLPSYLNTTTNANHWRLGGKLESGSSNVGCNTCHSIHGTNDGQGANNAAAIWPFLLATDNTPTDRAPLCEACHGGGLNYNYNADNIYVGSVKTAVDSLGQAYDDHPIDIEADGAPALDNWQKTRRYESHVEGGAANDGSYRWPYGTSTKSYAIPGLTNAGAASAGRVVCISCHSAHAGRLGESLRRECLGAAAADAKKDVNNVAFGGGGYLDWCFSCHAISETVPAYHHSTGSPYTTAPVSGDVTHVQGNTDPARGASGIGCNDCHQMSAGSLKAHNGFFNLMTPTVGGVIQSTLAGSELCLMCHINNNLNDSPTNSGYLSPLGGNLPNFNPHVDPTDPTNQRTHYIGIFNNSAAQSIQVKVNPWRTVAYSGNPAQNIYSKYGGVGAVNTRHLSAPTLTPGASTIVCESCHSVLFNTGYEVYTSTTEKLYGGWKVNLLLELYQEVQPGNTNGFVGERAAGVQSDDATQGKAKYGSYGAVFCIECHRQSVAPAGLIKEAINKSSAVTGITVVPMNMHPMSGWSITRAQDAGRTPVTLITANQGLNLTYADQTNGPGTYPNNASYPSTDHMDCNSCHRPHMANANGYWTPRTGTTDGGTGVSVILEKDKPGDAPIVNDYGPFCRNCHNM